MKKYMKIDGKYIIIKIREPVVEKTKVVKSKKVYNRNKLKKIYKGEQYEF